MKVLLVATVQSHICQFHRPLVAMLHEHGCEVHVAARNNLAEKNGLKLESTQAWHKGVLYRSWVPFLQGCTEKKLAHLVSGGEVYVPVYGSAHYHHAGGL